MAENITTTALLHYDEYQAKFDKFEKHIHSFCLLIVEDNLVKNSLIFYDKHGEEITRSRVELIAQYDKIWQWGWSIIDANPKKIQISKNLLLYGIDIDPTSNYYFLKSELITPKFTIIHPIQFDLHLSIATYLSKKPFLYKIFPSILKENNELKNKTSRHCYLHHYTDDDNNINEDIHYYYLLDTENILEAINKLE